jgi:SAM-dependent MidA family methyltransferase
VGEWKQTFGDNPGVMTILPSLPSVLETHLVQVIRDSGGWIGFDRFMEHALYAPGLGYYARDGAQFGVMPAGVDGQGSDFVTAPEMSPFFGRALAMQLAQALQVTATRELWEFGAGSGVLAARLLEVLGERLDRYTIVDLSGALRQRQAEMLRGYGAKVQWVTELPQRLRGVVVGNEVLDAMPVKLLARKNGVWHERGVQVGSGATLAWEDRISGLRPPVDIDGPHDYLTEIHRAAEGFVRTLADRLEQGAVFLIDYGFPEREYYHVQRAMGTVMCHQAHRMDTDPLVDIGHKDITAHVNFTGLALAAQDATTAAGNSAHGVRTKNDDFGVLGYTTQARFLLNCGLLPMLEQATLQERAMAQKLVMEHEMGELFKVIGFFKGAPWEAIGFAQGDRTHTL